MSTTATLTTTSDSVMPMPTLEAIKAKQQIAWSSGNYATIGVTLQIVGESLCESVDLCSGERVLDVAAGNGNATLAAARRFAYVTSTDYVEHLLDQAGRRAEAEQAMVDFRIADAENLPFEDESFDVVLSTFGVMFTPNQERAASELMRVTRSGGRIGLANWTPEGFIGQLFKTIGKHVAPPAGLKPPSLWGTGRHIAELFGSKAADIRMERKAFNFRYRSAEHWIDLFRDYYGPMVKAFEALDTAGQDALYRDLQQLLTQMNQGGERSLVVPSEFMEIVISKR